MEPILLHLFDPQERLISARVFRLWGFEPDPEKHYQHELAQWYRSPLSGPDHQTPPTPELEALWRRLADAAARSCTVVRRGPWLTLRDAPIPGETWTRSCAACPGSSPAPSCT